MNANEDTANHEPEIDPEEFVRALLKISPEDAEKVREETPGTRKRPEPQTGPPQDQGSEKEERPDQWPDRSHGNGL